MSEEILDFDQEDQSGVVSFVIDVYPSGTVAIELGSFPIYSLVPVLERALAVGRSWCETRRAVIFDGSLEGAEAIYTDSSDEDEYEDEADSEEGEQGA